MIFLNTTFWNYAIERAIKTFAQAAIATLGTGTLGLLTIDWINVLSIAGGATLLSILTSIASHTGKKSQGD